VVADTAHPVLSDMHIATAGPFVPFHANVQRVRPPGIVETWSDKGTISRHLANLKVQSMGWLGL